MCIRDRFIEPLQVARLYDEVQELKIDEENEEIRILYTLSSMLSDKEAIIQSNSRTVEKLDFIFAKGDVYKRQVLEALQKMLKTAGARLNIETVQEEGTFRIRLSAVPIQNLCDCLLYTSHLNF